MGKKREWEVSDSINTYRIEVLHLVSGSTEHLCNPNESKPYSVAHHILDIWYM